MSRKESRLHQGNLEAERGGAHAPFLVTPWGPASSSWPPLLAVHLAVAVAPLTPHPIQGPFRNSASEQSFIGV